MESQPIWTQMLNIEYDSLSSVFFTEQNTWFCYPDYHYIIQFYQEV